MLKIKISLNCYDWHQATYSAELPTLTCNTHILQHLTSLHKHYILLEGRKGEREKEKEKEEGKQGTEGERKDNTE
jgi:hypothetical protein